MSFLGRSEHEGRFLYVYLLLAFIATAFIVSAAWQLAVKDVRVETRTVNPPALDAKTDPTEIRQRLGEPQGQVAGQTVGLDGATCDVYQGEQYVLLLCHA